MRLSSPLLLRILGFAFLAFFLIYWLPFSHALPDGLPMRFGTYRTIQASIACVWVLVALGLNILTGYNGQISLGHTAFVATGGYTAAILMADHGWPFWAVLIPAAVVSGALGLAVGIPALRLSGPYLAMATMALALAAPQVLKKYDGLTHGTQGISVRGDWSTAPGFIGDMVTQDQWSYFVALFLAVVMTLIAWNVIRGRVGRAFVAIRDSEVAAASMGINVPRYKTIAFAISAIFAGIAGAAYVQIVGYIAPESFNVLRSINFLTTIVVGGLASILGSILGAISFKMVDDISDFLPLGEGPMAEQVPWALYGGLLIVVVTIMPYGMAGAIRRFQMWLAFRKPSERRVALGGPALGIVAAIAVSELAGGSLGIIVGLVVALAITYSLWLPALVRGATRGYGRWVGALRGSRGPPGFVTSEDASDERSDAER